MNSFSWQTSEILTIELESSAKDVIDLLRIRFDNLYEGSVRGGIHTTVTIREVDSLPLVGKRVVREISIPEYCVFNDESFYIIRGRKRIHVPFDAIGNSNHLMITYERGFPADWIRRLLDDILAFHFVGFGVSFVHAACLRNATHELVIPAWRGTGKTHLALRLLFSGEYEYKAEDQFFLDSSGAKYVYTDACHVDPKHMRSFPQIRRKYRSVSYSARVGVSRLLLPLLPPINAAFEFARRVVLKLFHPKVYVKMGDFVPGFALSHEQHPQTVALQLVTEADAEGASATRISVDELASSLLGGMQYERLDLYPFYFAWVYATGQRNSVIDNVHDAELAILKRGFRATECFRVTIPSEYNWDMGQDLLDELLHQT